MRTLLFDADIPERVVDAMVALRLPAISIKRIPGAVRDDMRVIEVAKTFDAILVVLDKDYNAEPLMVAMVEKGARVVRLRLPQCKPEEVVETLARMILSNYRDWQELLDATPGIVSCSDRGNRLRTLDKLPWHRETKDQAHLE
jgi:predicted nuclease of predicted toxin-antitoxin system